MLNVYLLSEIFVDLFGGLTDSVYLCNVNKQINFS